MVLPIDPTEKFTFVCTADKALPPEQQTVFELGVLPFAARTQAEAEMQFGDGTVQMSPTFQRNMLRATLRGWTNFKNPRTGEDIQFERELADTRVWGLKLRPPTDRTLGFLHPEDRLEIVLAAFNVQRMTVEEGND